MQIMTVHSGGFRIVQGGGGGLRNMKYKTAPMEAVFFIAVNRDAGGGAP